jgi:putative copper export protein
MLIELVLRWIHVLSAAVLVGGTIFLRYALAPALAQQASETRQSLLGGWRPGWARLVMIASALLLISGLVNAVRIIMRYEFPAAPYHALVAVKFLLAMVMFWSSAAVAGRSASAEKMRENLTFWLNINVLLAILLVGLAGYMRLTPRDEKSSQPASQQVAPALVHRS